MLATDQRLRKQSDIDSVHTNGRKAYHPLFRVVYLPNKLTTSRVAVVAGYKVSKRAVQRNLVKRRVRAVLKEKLPRIQPPHDVIIITQRAALDAKQDQLGQALEEVLVKKKLYA